MMDSHRHQPGWGTLARTNMISGARKRGLLSRAHPPIPPGGRARKRRPRVRWCARASERRSSEGRDRATSTIAADLLTAFIGGVPDIARKAAHHEKSLMTKPTQPTQPLSRARNTACCDRNGILSVVSGSSEREVLTERAVSSVLSSLPIAADHRFRQFCQFRHRCMLRQIVGSVGSVSSVRGVNGSPLKSAATQAGGNSTRPRQTHFDGKGVRLGARETARRPY